MPSRLGSRKVQLSRAASATSALAQIQAMFGAAQGIIYDATDPTAMFQERTGASATTLSGADGVIGSLKDLSPNGNWCIAPSDSARPISRQGVGAPNLYADFDGSNDYLAHAVAMPSNQWTRITCVQIRATGAAPRIFSSPNNNATLLVLNGTNQWTMVSGNLATGFVQDPGTTIVCSEVNRGDGTSTITRNNDSDVTLNPSNGVPDGIYIGTSAFISSFAQMYFFRTVMINRILTAPEIAICRTWCGVAGGLSL